MLVKTTFTCLFMSEMPCVCVCHTYISDILLSLIAFSEGLVLEMRGQINCLQAKLDEDRADVCLVMIF